MEATPSSKDVNIISTAQVRTPNSRRAIRVAPKKHGPATTPHAIRALQQRRTAALTPSRNKRRSGRLQRETPRDTLRNLSKILAISTQQIEPSPQPLQIAGEDLDNLSHDELEMDPDPPMPSLSKLVNGYNEEESFHALTHNPRESYNDNEQTQHSVEIPRKAYGKHPLDRISRESFGSIRVSDRFTELNNAIPEIMSDDLAQSELQTLRWGGDGDLQDIGRIRDVGDDTADLRRALAENSYRRQSHSQSTIRQDQLFHNDDDLIFAFDVPAEPGMRKLSPNTRHDHHLSSSYHEHVQGNQIVNNELLIRKNVHRARKTKVQKTSHHGILYRSLAPAMIKKLVLPFIHSSGTRKARVNKGVIDSLMQASDCFFEQIGDDLGTFAKHAKRKTVEEPDTITLMRRQRQLNATVTPFSLALKYLPREFLQQIRMAPPTSPYPQRQRDEVELPI